jgi:hypothetical protein
MTTIAGAVEMAVQNHSLAKWIRRDQDQSTAQIKTTNIASAAGVLMRYL